MTQQEILQRIRERQPLSPQKVLKQAKDFMQDGNLATWHTYEHFKNMVRWCDSQEYDSFIEQLTEILQL